MAPAASIAFTADLRGDGRAAADRLARALDDIPGPGATTARLAGQIRYPRVELWRSRGFGVRSQLARFEGAIEAMGNGAVLTGRIVVPEAASLLVNAITAVTIVFFVIVVASAIMAGWVAFFIVSGVFGALLSLYLYGTRRFVRSGSSAEAQLLIQEIRELVNESASYDS